MDGISLRKASGTLKLTWETPCEHEQALLIFMFRNICHPFGWQTAMCTFAGSVYERKGNQMATATFLALLARTKQRTNERTFVIYNSGAILISRNGTRLFPRTSTQFMRSFRTKHFPLALHTISLFTFFHLSVSSPELMLSDTRST